MRWLWRFLIYFIKPLAIWYIAGYFSFLSIRAIANAVASYERSIKKAEIAARAKAEGGAERKASKAKAVKHKGEDAVEND